MNVTAYIEVMIASDHDGELRLSSGVAGKTEGPRECILSVYDGAGEQLCRVHVNIYELMQALKAVSEARS